MCYSISLTPSKFCSNKQKLFRMHTTRKQRYPASQLLTWDLRMPANLRCMTRLQRHPTGTLFWDPLFLIFLFACCLLGYSLPLGHICPIGRAPSQSWQSSPWRLLVVEQLLSCCTHWIVMAHLPYCAWGENL